MRLPVSANVPETQGFKLTHRGVDYSARYDKTVYAPEAGTVSTEYQPYAGGNVLVLKGKTGTHKFAHLSKYLVRSGTVKQGQKIAIMGATGKVTAAHLHWSLYRFGIRVDPRKYVTTSVQSKIMPNEKDVIGYFTTYLRDANGNPLKPTKAQIASYIKQPWQELATDVCRTLKNELNACKEKQGG